MKALLKPVFAVGLAMAAVSAPLASTPVMAQQAQKIGVVNVPGIVANSTAYQTANTQRQTTYAAQIQQAQTRQQALEAQIQPLVAAFNAARQQQGADQTALAAQAQQIQQLQQQGSQELNRILAPVALSQAYVEEQIEARLAQAVQAAAEAQGVTLVITPDVVLYASDAHNLNEAVLAQLNALIPSAQIVPPQGWVPREIREQQAAQQAAQQQQAQQPAGEVPSR